MTKDSARTLLIFFTGIVLPNPVHSRRSEFNDIHGASEVSFGIPKLGRANLKFEIESVGIGYMQRLALNDPSQGLVFDLVACCPPPSLKTWAQTGRTPIF
jgi:hypothetical protein